MTNGTTTWSYEYNADGLRTSRSNGATTYNYIYNGTSLVQMTVGDDTLYFGTGTVTYNGVVYYYVTNLQGDVIAILDALGANVVEYSYDAWGNILTTSGTMADTLGTVNPLRYRGYVYDTETGLYYLQSRYYNPEVGRFINADAFASTGQGFLGNNMFAYCLNNPTNYMDKSGAYTEALEWWITTMWWLPAADTVLIFGEIIFYGGIIILGICELYTLVQTTSKLSAEEEEKAEPDIPDVTYPGDDPTKAPEDTTWKGKGEQGTKEGNYYNPETGESWHPDLEHPDPIGPHWDYNYRGSGVDGWRVFPDGRVVPKFSQYSCLN